MGSNTSEHVYIVFAQDISIDEGVSLIQQSVLRGRTLEVTRRDVTGNAVVAIVTSGERAEIKELDVVIRIKVEVPAIKLSGQEKSCGRGRTKGKQMI